MYNSSDVDSGHDANATSTINNSNKEKANAVQLDSLETNSSSSASSSSSILESFDLRNSKMQTFLPDNFPVKAMPMMRIWDPNRDTNTAGTVRGDVNNQQKIVINSERDLPCINDLQVVSSKDGELVILMLDNNNNNDETE